MFRTLLIGLLTLGMLSSFAHSTFDQWENPFEIRTHFVSVKLDNYINDMLKLKNADVDIWGMDFKQKIVDVHLSDSELARLKKLGLELIIHEGPLKILAAGGVDEEYKDPSEVSELLYALEERYPEIAKVHIIGQSLEGRDILAIKISDEVLINDENEPAVLFNSMHHAREVMTPEVPLDMANYLVSGYESDQRVKEWVDNNEIWVLPMLNVDGNNRVWNGSKSWRKNTRGGHGVDINRNYPYNWNTCNGSSGNTWSQTYRGESAGSEPETQAMMDLVKNIRPVFNISYHSYSELVLYPYGCQGERVPTREIVEGIGDHLGELLDYTAGTPWDILYGVDGGDVDWMYGAYQVIPYVIELNSRSEGFWPPYHPTRDITVERNRIAWQYLLDRLKGPGIKGLVNKADVEIDIYAKDELIQTYKVNPDMSYHIVLNPGTYRLDYRAEGEIYANKKVEVASQVVNIKM